MGQVRGAAALSGNEGAGVPGGPRVTHITGGQQVITAAFVCSLTAVSGQAQGPGPGRPAGGAGQACITRGPVLSFHDYFFIL